MAEAPGSYGNDDGAPDRSGTMRTLAAIDVLLIAAMISGALAGYNLIDWGRPDQVVVFKRNSIIAEYPLSNNAEFSISGQIGAIDVEIRDGAARIIHADCPRLMCKRAGAINGPHGQIICAPNNVLIRIRPSKISGDNNVDGVAY